MPSLSEVITELIEKHGGVKSKISRKLGLKPNGKPIYSPQKLGHYATGKYLPKAPFFKAWKEKIGDDIESLIERNVSHETKVPPTRESLIVPAEVWEELRKNNQQFRKTRDEDVRDKKEITDEKKELLRQNGKLIDIFHDLTIRGIIPHKG